MKDNEIQQPGQDICSLCGKVLTNRGDKSKYIEDTIEGVSYRFDSKDCATMFKRFLSVYGDTFRFFSGQHQYISDPFWDRAIPKEEELKEIEEEQMKNISYTARKSTRDIIVISDPLEVQQLGFDLLRSAKEDISIIFSTGNAFLRQVRTGGIQLLEEIRKHRTDLNIRIITPTNENIRRVSLEISRRLGVKVKHIVDSMQSKITLVVVDRKYSLAVELKDDTKDSLYQAIGLGIYSNHKSTVLSYITIFESLWKELEINEQVASLCEQLRSREKMQTEFINIAAHEFRAPIQPILGLAEILRARENVDIEKQQELLTVIIRNARRLKTLTENILDSTRIENQPLVLHQEFLNVEDVIYDAIQDINSQSDKTANVRIIYDPLKAKHKIRFVKADKGRLIQVISNLLDNAIKFTEDGTITIKLDENTNKNEIVVSITDGGIGIGKDIESLLFTKFMTKANKGTGLGLYISKNIIDAHGGTIWAENNENGKGATFSFSLPMESSR
ncbi:MAG TPA: HAMP domain-containing sensor histidine kinase [Nitrososphaeraceae archaeon]